MSELMYLSYSIFVIMSTAKTTETQICTGKIIVKVIIYPFIA